MYRASGKRTGGVVKRFLRMLPNEQFDKSGLVGFGIGTAYQGASRFIKSRGEMPRHFESEYERVTLELGVVGLVIVVLLRISIFLFILKSFFKSRNRDAKIILTVLVLYQLPAIVGLQSIIYNTTQGAIYWFAIGLVVAINRLTKEQDAKSFSYPPMQTV